jgi:hypothetical protein
VPVPEFSQKIATPSRQKTKRVPSKRLDNCNWQLESARVMDTFLSTSWTLPSAALAAVMILPVSIAAPTYPVIQLHGVDRNYHLTRRTLYALHKPTDHRTSNVPQVAMSSSQQAAVLNNEGVHMLRCGDFEGAIQSFQRGLSLLKEITTSQGLGEQQHMMQGSNQSSNAEISFVSLEERNDVVLHGLCGPQRGLCFVFDRPVLLKVQDQGSAVLMFSTVLLNVSFSTISLICTLRLASTWRPNTVWKA